MSVCKQVYCWNQVQCDVKAPDVLLSDREWIREWNPTDWIFQSQPKVLKKLHAVFVWDLHLAWKLLQGVSTSGQGSGLDKGPLVQEILHISNVLEHKCHHSRCLRGPWNTLLDTFWGTLFEKHTEAPAFILWQKLSHLSRSDFYIHTFFIFCHYI